MTVNDYKIQIEDVSVSYGKTNVLRHVSLDIPANGIFAIIGPANSGKTSFLKVLNRMDTFNSNMSFEGDVFFNGLNTRDLRNLYALRSRVGVVFPLPVGAVTRACSPLAITGQALAWMSVGIPYFFLNHLVTSG